MLLKNKIRITVAIMLVIAIIAPLVSTVQYLTTGLKYELASFEKEEVNKLHDTVKNFVDLVYDMTRLNYRLISNRSNIANVFGGKLRGEIDIVMHFLKLKAAEVGKNGKTLEQAQKEAKHLIHTLRLEDGLNYIWVLDRTLPIPKMVLHPLAPELNGTIMDNPKYNCARGKAENHCVVAAEIATTIPEGGYFDHLWTKVLADGSKIPNVAKVSFAKLFPEWGWILGTGIYIDDAIKKGIEGLKSNISRMRYDGGHGFFWLHDKTGTLLCHGNQNWLETIKKSTKKNSIINYGLELIYNNRQGGFFEFKGSIEEFGKSDNRIGYARVFEPLNWVIGTSLSRSSLDNRIALKSKQTGKKIKKIVLTGFVFFICFSILAVFVIGKMLGSSGLIDTNDSRITIIETKKNENVSSSGETKDNQSPNVTIQLSDRITKIEDMLEKLIEANKK